MLALSDGRVAAATSDWARLRVWHPDDESITPVEFLEVHATSSIWSLAELPDGRIVSAGADDWAVRVWNPAEPTAEPVLYDGHTGLVAAVAVLPDGRVASAGRDNDATVHVWDPDAPTDSVLVLSGHSLAVNDVAVLDDGRLVSADWGGSVYFWDLADPSAPTATFTDPSVDDSEPGHIGTDTITQLADGRLALGSLGGIVRILDPDSLDGSTVFTDLGTVRDVVALDDGRLAWGGDQNTVTVQDPNQPAGTGVIYDAHTFSVSGLDALADGRIVSGSWDGTVRIWHPDTL